MYAWDTQFSSRPDTLHSWLFKVNWWTWMQLLALYPLHGPYSSRLKCQDLVNACGGKRIKSGEDGGEAKRGTLQLHPSDSMLRLNPAPIPQLFNTYNQCIRRGPRDDASSTPDTYPVFSIMGSSQQMYARHPLTQACADMTKSEVDVLIIGAGPTGLGAAKRLQQLVCSKIIITTPFVVTNSL